MAFHAKGFRSRATPLGVPSDTADPGNVRQEHTYVTNDDRAAVETSNYFDPLLTPSKKVRNGDGLTVYYDIDGTPGGRNYVITIVNNHVVITPFFDAT